MPTIRRIMPSAPTFSLEAFPLSRHHLNVQFSSDPTNRQKDQMHEIFKCYLRDCRALLLVLQSPIDTKVSTVNCLPQMKQIGSYEW